jgi:predicted nucleic acid-binding protein
MVLVDTSVWVEHFRRGNARLRELLVEGLVLIHPFVIGELACGNLKNRVELFGYLDALPGAPAASDDETLQLIEGRKLWGRGIGWIDAHLLAAGLLARCEFWTDDSRLRRTAAELGITLFR